jgi:hypothetical protein
MVIFYVSIWLYLLAKLLKVGSGLCQVMLAATFEAGKAKTIRSRLRAD